MAIDDKHKILKDVVNLFYTEQITIAQIDNVACKMCSHRDKNGLCPLDNNERCTQTDEECVDIFVNWLLKEGEFK